MNRIEIKPWADIDSPTYKKCGCGKMILHSWLKCNACSRPKPRKCSVCKSAVIMSDFRGHKTGKKTCSYCLEEAERKKIEKMKEELTLQKSMAKVKTLVLSKFMGCYKNDSYMWKEMYEVAAFDADDNLLEKVEFKSKSLAHSALYELRNLYMANTINVTEGRLE